MTGTAAAGSEYSSTEFSAAQPVGAPQTPGICEEVATTWSPLRGDPGPGWLEVTYATPVRATSVEVHETIEAPFVTQIDLRDTLGVLHTVWAATDATSCGGVLVATFPETAYSVTGVVVRTAAPSWEQIDAVEPVGHARRGGLRHHTRSAVRPDGRTVRQLLGPRHHRALL